MIYIIKFINVHTFFIFNLMFLFYKGQVLSLNKVLSDYVELAVIVKLYFVQFKYI